jgi:hypothetical protein
MVLNNNIIISKEDENFLKEFLKDFYRQIIRIEHFPNFENILTEWMKYYFIYNEKESEIILKLMENHEQSDNWFSSLIGFFYEFGIGLNDDYYIINKNKFLKLYLFSIKKVEINSMYHLLNIIIAKYLLSYYYYKDIILDKKNSITKKLEYMSYDQFENYNGLEINLCKDEISTIEKYFESPDKGFNQNKMEYDKKSLIPFKKRDSS